jgi:hypothetical protein
MDACSFCGAKREQVGHLVVAPAITICDRCIARAADAVDTDEGAQCTFCHASRASFIVGEVGICPDCVRLAADVVAEAAPASLPRAELRRPR